jgi:organic radical activating enzyme
MEDNLNLNRFVIAKQELDKISPSMCLAKWNQVTIHLGTGQNHSCHHPTVHTIPLSEIAKSPAALHNTQFKKEQRKLMLEGERPSECDYCWRAEDAQTSEAEGITYSDRITKSAEDWAFPHLNAIKEMPWDADVNPTYLEVSFDTACNFKCAYCSPQFSTTWRDEIERFGPYNLDGMELHGLDYLEQTGSMPMPITKHNPYIEAFWKWWPDMIKDLKIFRITGGEPLMSKQVFKVLDFLIENPQPQLEFNINSNLDVPPALFESFMKKMKTIQENNCVKKFKVYTSCEGYGKRAEYIRFGMNYDRWLANCHRVLAEIPDSQLTVMAAYNILSMSSFDKLILDVVEMKHKYTVQPTRQHPVSLDTPYVRWPEQLAPWTAPRGFLPYVEDSVTLMFKNLQQMHWLPLCGKGFFDYEVNRFKRLYYVIREEMHNLHSDREKTKHRRAQFADYITEYDRRRGTNFVETFPEYEEFYNKCKTHTRRWKEQGPY